MRLAHAPLTLGLALFTHLASGCSSPEPARDGGRPPADGGTEVRVDARSDARDAASDAAPGTPPDASVPVDDLDRWLPRIPASDCELDVPFEPAHGDPAALHPRTVCAEGCDHATLGDALAAAEPFDEIVLAAGEYDECAVVRTSPIVIRSEGGLARFTDVECPETGSLFVIHSEHARLSGIRVEGFRGRVIQLYPTVRQAVISRVWIEDADSFIGGSVADGEVWIDQVKTRNVGWREGPETHQTSIISHGDLARLWITRSVFSHFRQQSWLLSTHAIPHIEMVCNVVAKPGPEEAEHSLHIYYPVTMVMRNNYFHETHGRIVLYNYDLGSENDLVLTGNHFLFDHEAGDFVGLIQPSSHVSAIDNVVVGGIGVGALDGRMTREARDNVAYATRAEAGLEAAPAIPSSWPIEL
jgi:hypothetical protein